VNRLILKYPYPITAVILLIFAWVVIQQLARGVDAIIPLMVAAVVVWPLATFVFVYLWPRITVGGFKRAILSRGFGAGPIPLNTLYAVPERPSDSAASGSLMAVGTDDVVYIAGWLDVKAGARVLHVPEMDGRYYGVQFTDPGGIPAGHAGTQRVSEEVVVAVPPPVVVQRDNEQISALERLEHLLTIGTTGQRITESARHLLQHRGVEQKRAHHLRLPA